MPETAVYKVFLVECEALQGKTVQAFNNKFALCNWIDQQTEEYLNGNYDVSTAKDVEWKITVCYMKVEDFNNMPERNGFPKELWEGERDA